MRFSTSLALVAATIVPAALAQVTIDPLTLTQCATSTINIKGSSGPYYIAVIPAQDPCTDDAFAEFYDVEHNSVEYTANIPSGTQVQVYVLDVNNVETWGGIETVGDGDASCLQGASSSSSPDSPTSESAAPSSYVAPARVASTSASTYNTYSSDNTDNTSNTDNTDTPANAADNTTGGASTLTASASLLVGAIVAAAALL